MALAHSPKIVTDGLVFAYDMGNTQKSWRGAPVTNLAVYTDYSNRNYDTLYDIGGFGGDDADVFYYRNGGYNNLPYKKMVKHTGGTGGSYINEHSYFTLVEGTTYIITCYMKSNAVTTVSGHTLALNRDSDNAYRVPADIALTTDWVKQSWTYTCAVGEGGTTYHFRQIVYNDTSLPVEVYWCGLQISVGTVSYPYVNGARSNTQAIVDLMGTNTITATSLTYAADNTFSFNGSSNYIDSGPVALTGTSTQSLTWACWASSATANGDIINMVYPTAGWNMCPIYASGQIFYGKVWSSASLAADFSFTLNQYYYLVLTRNNTTNTNSFYVNGRLVASQTGATYSASGNANNHYFGRAGSQATNTHFNGKIPSGQIYTKALSQQEIQQNFNALRSRYGV